MIKMNVSYSTIFYLVSIFSLNVTNAYRISFSNITKKELCLTEACIETSNQLFKSMDRTIDPCQDFNKFVCGRFIKESIIPEKQQQIDLTTTKLKDIMYDRGQKLMTTTSESSEDVFQIDDKVRNFYATCSDAPLREKVGVEPLLNILKSIGGWPVLSSNGKYVS